MFEGLFRRRRRSGIQIDSDILPPSTRHGLDILAPGFDLDSWLFVPLPRYLRAMGIQPQTVMAGYEFREDDIRVMNPDVTDFLCNELDKENPLTLDPTVMLRLNPLITKYIDDDESTHDYLRKILDQHSAYSFPRVSLVDNHTTRVIKPLSLDYNFFDYVTDFNRVAKDDIERSAPAARDDIHASYWLLSFFHELGHDLATTGALSVQALRECACDQFAIVSTIKATKGRLDPSMVNLALRATSRQLDGYEHTIPLSRFIYGGKGIDMQEMFDTEEQFVALIGGDATCKKPTPSLKERFSLYHWGKSVLSGHALLNEQVSQNAKTEAPSPAIETV